MHSLVTLLALALIAAAASADTADEVVDGLAVPIVGGIVKLDIRARYGYADIDELCASNAATVRTRLGYGTQPWRGCPPTPTRKHRGGRPRRLLRRHPAQLARPVRDR